MNSLLLSWPSSVKKKKTESNCDRWQKYVRRTVVIENGENDMDHVIAQIHVGNGFGHVFQRCLIDRCARDVVEHQRGVHVIDVAQKPEEIQVILLGHALARLKPVGIRVTSPVGRGNSVT